MSCKFEFLELDDEKNEFFGRWIGSICHCINSASFTVLVNGSPSEFLLVSRGLQ